MPNNFALGIPTEYGFELPRKRHALARPYLAGPDATLLDFGCGNGANTVLFAPDVRQVVGVDVVPEHVEQASKYAAEQGLGNVEYVLYDGDRLPFPDASFDNVVSFEVLEHTADDRHALAEVRRVLKPGGVLAMSVPNKWYLMETHGFDLRPRWVKWNRVPLLSWLPTPIHERYACARIYTRRRIFRLLEAGGFEVLEHRYIMPPFDRVNRPLPRKVLRAVFRRIDASPLRVIGVAHFIAARRRA
ncbi:class I SAM-dependent methyltransferase [Carbonactinospora thermoautotrophica]|uniref:class I SAM-dependent methyltransferase n=1 Tax=Carbonactinospora thermoautotrophica TaxID=1469144 RepID=UPI0008335194|nr:class I SAM-dependent methyltransferase [Carbonactinospora thermoautotrophica]